MRLPKTSLFHSTLFTKWVKRTAQDAKIFAQICHLLPLVMRSNPQGLLEANFRREPPGDVRFGLYDDIRIDQMLRDRVIFLPLS